MQGRGQESELTGSGHRNVGDDGRAPDQDGRLEGRSMVGMYPVSRRSVVLLCVQPGMALRSENHAMKGTAMTTTETTIPADVVDSESEYAEEPVEEILIEEISIDGMCGVY